MVAPTVRDVARFSPPVPGVVFRAFAGIDADMPGMAEVARRQRQASGEIEPVDEAEMRASYAHLERSDPAHDVLVAELDGAIVGYSRVEWGDTNDGERYYDGFCFLDPGARRRGIGSAMLSWNEARRRAIAAD